MKSNISILEFKQKQINEEIDQLKRIKVYILIFFSCFLIYLYANRVVLLCEYYYDSDFLIGSSRTQVIDKYGQFHRICEWNNHIGGYDEKHNRYCENYDSDIVDNLGLYQLKEVWDFGPSHYIYLAVLFDKDDKVIGVEVGTPFGDM